ncbi:TetR/AcrR family transcriptional regulator [Bacillus glycinifermentans]|uniref:TetR/AcrR family transcriptional regulator n=1 Tax=Bacillus glycinifermentans TaxID=1664069 RepID=A0A0T6BT39_9BACI|nr:TetR/AcrR family transcriptional regulator [Bacillus glycinifermentans]ATH92702.1 TetR/AcrR family transcriptional regulator [Bacillus glycinifermentans]KRT94791.1 hypothetical protein AB447_214155 [Bacillus glycinifermentans]MEC0485525.1 TetR/AcrR family transcriptional regulator [Bacillus glycinifermentans]MEC3605655.1 TetR/AcrR family transcriptional regulator [Bacillus glycinifermentans]UOY90243.1 TetR/AcrR family transcriptional regulator [Bacillus glycinifermentans]
MTKHKGENRREAILEAAVHVFAHKGYYRATTGDVAKEANISQPYIYHFYKNKEELLTAALRKAWDRILRSFDTVSGDPGDIEERFIKTYENLMQTHKDEILLQVQAQAIREMAVQEVMQEGLRTIKDYVLNRFQAANIENAPQKVSDFLARGMLCNVAAALDMPELMPNKHKK